MRCLQCKKKTSIEFDCKCSKKFCINCLPWYNHNCAFDYKQNRSDHLKKTVVEVKNSKVDDI
jgi:hypothetical protein